MTQSSIVDEALDALSPAFERLYAPTGRPSIPPEKLETSIYRIFGRG